MDGRFVFLQLIYMQAGANQRRAAIDHAHELICYIDYLLCFLLHFFIGNGDQQYIFLALNLYSNE